MSICLDAMGATAYTRGRTNLSGGMLSQPARETRSQPRQNTGPTRKTPARRRINAGSPSWWTTAGRLRLINVRASNEVKTLQKPSTPARTSSDRDCAVLVTARSPWFCRKVPAAVDPESYPGNHDTLKQCWCNVGPASATLSKRYTNIV